MTNELSKLGYPAWAQKKIISGIPQSDAAFSVSHISVKLVIHPWQEKGAVRHPTGHEILDWLVADRIRHVAAATDPIQDCVDISLLRSWEKDPKLIPAFCRGSLVGAWQSVFVGPENASYLPCLWCFKDGSVRMDYLILSLSWHEHEKILVRN